MRVLLDENVPRRVRGWLAGHDVLSVNDRALGWKGVRNGDLLARMAGRFDVLITADRSLRAQQKLAGRPVGVLVLPTNSLTVLWTLAPAIARAVADVRAGEAIVLDRDGAVRRRG